MFTIPMVPLLNGPTTFIVSEIWNNPFWGVITPVYTHTRNGFVQKWVHIIAPNSKFKTEIWGAKPLDSHFIFEPWTSFLRLYLTCLFLDFTIFFGCQSSPGRSAVQRSRGHAPTPHAAVLTWRTGTRPLRMLQSKPFKIHMAIRVS